jgi:hypothetical protein
MIIDRILYDAGGHTGKSYYVRHVESDTDQIFNTITGALSLTTTWSDSVTELTENDATGQFPIPLPNLLPAGHAYNVVIYEMLGSVPVNTDNVLQTYNVQRGSIFGF